MMNNMKQGKGKQSCQEKALVIANTLFQQYKRQPYTWTSLDGKYQNQINYILCSQRWRSKIKSGKKGWVLTGSDHVLLMENSGLNGRMYGKPLDHSGMT